VISETVRDPKPKWLKHGHYEWDEKGSKFWISPDGQRYPMPELPPRCRECPECGAQYKGRHLEAHMRRAHGTAGGGEDRISTPSGDPKPQ
jgi:hypothetical protein